MSSNFHFVPQTLFKESKINVEMSFLFQWFSRPTPSPSSPTSSSSHSFILYTHQLVWVRKGDKWYMKECVHISGDGGYRRNQLMKLISGEDSKNIKNRENGSAKMEVFLRMKRRDKILEGSPHTWPCGWTHHLFHWIIAANPNGQPLLLKEALVFSKLHLEGKKIFNEPIHDGKYDFSYEGLQAPPWIFLIFLRISLRFRESHLPMTRSHRDVC